MRRIFASLILLCASFFVALQSASAVTIAWTPVGNPGNAADPATGSTYGAVPYNYNIDAYDVTLGQYTAFLNAVAKTDTYGLYNSGMTGASFQGRSGSYPFGIAQTGSPGSYSYSVTGSNPQAANMPVFYETWGDAARFCNWLQNGQPTSGTEGTGTTETGAYTLNGATSNTALMAVTRNAGATYFIPNESEWYKAAYYSPLLNNGSGGYYPYATQPKKLAGGLFQRPDNSLLLANSESNDANYFINNDTDPTNYLTPVGTFSASPSYYGTFDQSGDVWNWTETVTPLFPSPGSGREWLGESWTNTLSPVFGAGDPSGGYYSTGFRVASVPEPSTGVLVVAACGLMWVLRKRFK